MKIPNDDLILFGSFGVLALGSALVVGASTGQAGLSVGVFLMVFGLLATVTTFLAAGAPE